MLWVLLAVLAAGPQTVIALGNDCHVWPNHRGDRALTACRSDDAMRLALVSRDGKTIQVHQVDGGVVQSAVPSGPAVWSPADTHVALEIGLDEEPGILLIDVS